MIAPFFTNTIPNVFKKFGVNIKDTLSNFKVKALDFLQNDVNYLLYRQALRHCSVSLLSGNAWQYNSSQ